MILNTFSLDLCITLTISMKSLLLDLFFMLVLILFIVRLKFINYSVALSDLAI